MNTSAAEPETDREKLKEILQEYGWELFIKLNLRLLADFSGREDGDGRILWVEAADFEIE
jgi:hypothetical protein